LSTNIPEPGNLTASWFNEIELPEQCLEFDELLRDQTVIFHFDGQHASLRIGTMALEALRVREYGVLPPGAIEVRGTSEPFGKLYTLQGEGRQTGVRRSAGDSMANEFLGNPASIADVGARFDTDTSNLISPRKNTQLDAFGQRKGFASRNKICQRLQITHRISTEHRGGIL
jgi:hypothetical protein